MNTEEIKEELKSVYHGHDEFEEIISAVDGTGHLVYWAGRLILLCHIKNQHNMLIFNE